MSLLDNASLLLTPNAYKEGKLYSVIPSNGNGDFTATRATTATRVNSAGLVDLVPYNLFGYSDMFSNALWGKTAISVTANTTTAPDGAMTADTLTGDGTNGNHYLVQSISLVTGLSYTINVYAKKNTNNFVQFAGSGTSFVANVWANFDLNLGVVGSVGSATTASIQNVGNGWYRCSITFTSLATTSNNFLFNLINSATSVRLETNTLSTSVFLWGAQLVEGTSARDYLRTETRLNIPRVDYSLGGCPNILLEPQRTNLALRSNNFSNAAWTAGSITLSDNSQLGIDGLTSACLVTTTAVGNFLFQNIAVTPLTAYTFTFYVKRGTMTDMKYRVRDVTNSVDVVTTTSYYNQTNASTFTRISITVTAPASCTSLRFYVMSDTNSVGTAIITSAQLEAGAYATSYIPTTTASVTRNADSITRNNIFTNGLITASGGTWFVELRNNVPLARDNASAAMFINTGTSPSLGDGFRIRNGGNARFVIDKVVASTPSTSYTTLTDVVKIAIKWNGSTADYIVNGVKVVSATAFTATAMENLNVSCQVPYFINEMALFPTPLTDAQCLALTA